MKFTNPMPSEPRDPEAMQRWVDDAPNLRERTARRNTAAVIEDANCVCGHGSVSCGVHR